ncbi:MAG: hypothetical protein AMXMBFR23_03200 [Chloroflexota bacterium]
MASNGLTGARALVLVGGGGVAAWMLARATRPAAASNNPTIADLPVDQRQLVRDVPRHHSTPSPAAAGVGWASDFETVDVARVQAGRVPYGEGARVALPGIGVAVFLGYDAVAGLSRWDVNGKAHAIAWDTKPSDYDWTRGYPVAASRYGNVATGWNPTTSALAYWGSAEQARDADLVHSGGLYTWLIDRVKGLAK